MFRSHLSNIEFTEDEVAEAIDQSRITPKAKQVILEKLFGEEDWHDALIGHTFEGGREQLSLEEIRMGLSGTGGNMSTVCMYLYNQHKEHENE